MGDLEDRAGVVKGLVEKFPETANQADKALSTTIRAINAALITIKPAIWGFEKIGEWLDRVLPEKLKDIPPENIITPPIHIAGPTIEAMRFTGENDILREMFANLLAASMNKDSVNEVHPRFIEIIKNISSDEARILSYFSTEHDPDIVLYQIELPDPQFKLKWFCLEYSNIPLNAFFDSIPNKLLVIYLNNLKFLGLFSETYDRLPAETLNSYTFDTLIKYFDLDDATD